MGKPMTLDTKVAEKIGETLREIFGRFDQEIWQLVDAEIEEQLKATSHHPTILSPSADGAHVVAVDLYEGDYVISLACDIERPDLPCRAEYVEQVEECRQQIAGLRRLAADATRLADEAEAAMKAIGVAP